MIMSNIDITTVITRSKYAQMQYHKKAAIKPDLFQLTIRDWRPGQTAGLCYDILTNTLMDSPASSCFINAAFISLSGYTCVMNLLASTFPDLSSSMADK